MSSVEIDTATFGAADFGRAGDLAGLAERFAAGLGGISLTGFAGAGGAGTTGLAVAAGRMAFDLVLVPFSLPAALAVGELVLAESPAASVFLILPIFSRVTVFRWRESAHYKVGIIQIRRF
jgi:hypothetical protein